MNNTVNKVKNIVVAMVAIFMAHRTWAGAESIGANSNLQIGIGTPLMIGIQLVMYSAMITLYAMAFQNLLEFYILWKYADNVEIKENTRKVIKFVIYVKIFVSLAMRLIFSSLFVMPALIAFFAPGVKTRDDGVYGAGIFMLVVSGFTIYTNIRLTAARVRELRGGKNEAEDV